MERKAYPSDISDDEWAFVAPYLILMIEEAPQREHSLREVFDGLRWLIRAGAAWRMMQHDKHRHGQQFINKRSDGSKLVYLRSLWMTSEPYCDWHRGESKTRRQ